MKIRSCIAANLSPPPHLPSPLHHCAGVHHKTLLLFYRTSQKLILQNTVKCVCFAPCIGSRPVIPLWLPNIKFYRIFSLGIKFKLLLVKLITPQDLYTNLISLKERLGQELTDFASKKYFHWSCILPT